MWEHHGRKATMLAAELTEGRWWEVPSRVLRGLAGYGRRWRVSRGAARQP
jgi:hypothetical protein